MGHMKRRPGRMVWSFLLSAAAFVASGAALAQVPITKFISVQPIDVCTTGGALCAPFNTVNTFGKPKTQNSTTNPIGFVYTYTNPTTNTKVYIDVTRALLNQIGIDVSWNPIVQYNSPIINMTTGQTFQTLNVVTNNSACGLPNNPATGFQSCDFLNLSQQNCISQNPTCKITSPRATPASVMNMFFVNTLNPPPGQTGSQLYGFSWVNNNGISIGSNTFFPPAPLTPFVDVLAHELLHNLGLDHTVFGAGPYNPVTVDPNGGALQSTPSSTPIGDCGSDYTACIGNLMTTGKLRTEPTVNCVAVSNPPMPGQTPCPGAPSLANGMADQLTTEAEEWPGLPQSQQGEILDPSGFLQPIANSMTTVTVPSNSNSMTVTVTGAANGGPQEALLAWVIVLPGALQFDNQFHITSQSRENLVQDADWPHPDQDNNTANGVYNLGTLYSVCAASTAQCLIVEFNVPGASSSDKITFSKGFTKPLTNADLCGAGVTSVFSHGYLTTGQLACPGGVVPSGGLMASSWTPDLTAPAGPQIVNQTAFMAAAAGNPPCTLGSTGSCPDPTLTGVSDANPSQEKQLCYFHGSPVQCP